MIRPCGDLGRYRLAEGITWDERSRRLLWVDIEGMGLFWSDDGADVTDSMQWESFVTFVAPFPNGLASEYVVAVGMSVYRVDIASGERTLIASIPSQGDEMRLNDGGIGPDGALYLGSMSTELRPGMGNLYRISVVDGRIETILSGLTIPNGLAWNRQGTRAYLIDSPSHTVRLYDFDGRTGRFSHGTNFIHIDDGFPDGMAVDGDGRLWIAHYDGWKISVWDGATGARSQDFHVPAAFVTCCCFDGEGDVIITTARRGIAEEDMDKQPHAGGIFRLHPAASALWGGHDEDR